MTQTKGKRVGNWDHIRDLGAGGYGYVSLVKNVTTGRYGAMKQLLDDRRREDFEREIRNAAKISNANPPDSLPRLRDNGIFENIGKKDERRIVDPVYFYVMDYVDGNAVDVETRKGRSALKHLSLNRRRYVLGAIAEALTFLHENEITHNDVKPLNIVLTRETASLVDYGSVRDTKNNTVTPPDQTPQYTPPSEESQLVFGYSDLYAFAITIYEVLSGGDYPFGDRGDLGQTYRGLKRDFRAEKPTWTKPPSQAMRRWVRREDRQKLDDLFAKVFDYRQYAKTAAASPISGVQNFWEKVKALIDVKVPTSKWMYLIGASIIGIVLIGIVFLILNTREPCDNASLDCLPTNTIVITGNLTESWSPTPIVTATTSATTIPTAFATHEATATQLSPESFLSTLAAMSATPFTTTSTLATEISTNTPTQPLETVSPTPTATDSPTATTVQPSLIPSSTSTLTSIPPTLTPTTLPPTLTAVQPTVTATDTRVVTATLMPLTAVRLEPANGELVRNGDYRMCREQMPNLCDLPTFELNRYRNAARVLDPVVGVSWRSAQNYCLLAGGRLPTAEEMLNLMQATSAPSFREWILPPNTSQELFASPEAVEAFEGQATAISANGEIVYSLITNSTEDTVFRCIPNAP